MTYFGGFVVVEVAEVSFLYRGDGDLIFVSDVPCIVVYS